jgi:hypothetical protein
MSNLSQKKMETTQRSRVPSLFLQAAQQVRFQAPESYEILRQSVKSHSLDVYSQEAINALELAHLQARGRIPRETLGCTFGYSRAIEEERLRLHALTRPTAEDEKLVASKKKRRRNEIDGAKLDSYSVETNSVRIRVDDSQNLPFWLEMDLPLDQLAQWLAEEAGLEMTLKRIRTDDREEEVVGEI